MMMLKSTERFGIALTYLVGLIYSAGLLCSAMMLSWLLLSRVDFMYPALYQLLDINETISQYAPQNRFKSGFENTTKTQHIEYFSQINHAINNHGDGLKDISYPRDSRAIPLLHRAEVVHLQDVANLIDKLTTAAVFALGSTLLALGYFYFKRQTPPPISSQAKGLAISLVILIGIGAVVGFVEVFYWLHQVIFPDDHQWYFFYQDSLMTTLMKAPILFGPISVLLVGLGGLLFISINVALHRLTVKHGC